MRPRARLAALALIAAVFLGAPAGAQELRVAIPWTPENLDPTMNLSSLRSQVGVSVFDSLVGRDAENRIVPELAESWKLLDDRTWQLRLRRGVVFHNGEPFNAEAVRFTFQRVLNPDQKSPNRANVAEIDRIDVVDDYTVNLVTRSPYAPFLARLIDFEIVAPRYTAEKGNQGLALRRAVSLRRAGQGRSPDRRGVRPALARGPADQAHRVQADPRAVHADRRPPER